METMVEYHGTGLAAPQVSTGLRVVLYEVHGEKRGKDVLEVPPTLLVNPTFEVLDDTEEEDFEACLSVPFLAAKVPRPKKIRVSALDTSGKTVSFVADDFHARVSSTRATTSTASSTSTACATARRSDTRWISSPCPPPDH